jgi:hypothetical protein
MTTQTRTNGSDAALLGIGSVRVDSLPATLLTDGAPATYTVEAIFTRRPDAEELTQILDGDMHQFLTHIGYPKVGLTVSNSRLEIANTNLEELRDGLAGLLSERLAAISHSARDRRHVVAGKFEKAAEHERDRVAAVAALAESVVFEPMHPGALGD